MSRVTVDGREYDMERLSPEARQQIANISGADEEIRRLKIRLAIYQTARNAYSSALQQSLPKE